MPEEHECILIWKSRKTADPSPAEPKTVPTPPAAQPRTKLGEPIHRRLLSKAPPFAEPVKTDALIRLAGYKPGSWSRQKVTDLVDAEELVRHPRNRGVSLPKL